MLAGLPADLLPDAARTEFERRLREHYPHATVRPQEALAAFAGPPVWYVTNRSYGSRVSAHIEVSGPPDLAYHVYVDRVMDWQTAFRLRPIRVQAHLVGSEYDVTYRVLGLTFQGRLRLVDADPPRSVRYEAEGGGFRVWYMTVFRPSERGTLIDVAGDYDVPNTVLARVADRIGLEGAIQRQIDHAHAALVDVCEEVATSPGEGPIPRDQVAGEQA
jgi:hypothetical protein